MSARALLLRVLRAGGAVVGYGGFALFLALIALQVMRWLRDGEWTHIGCTEGLHALLAAARVHPEQGGALSALSQWLDAPVHWLGLHRVLELLPASLMLFLGSVLGNFSFIYGRESLRDLEG